MKKEINLEDLLKSIDSIINACVKTEYEFRLNDKDIRKVTLAWIDATVKSGYVEETIFDDFTENNITSAVIKKELKKRNISVV